VDFDDSGATLKRLRGEYVYDKLGQVIEKKQIGNDNNGVSSFTSTRTVYDRQGLVMASIEDPDYGSSIDDGNELVSAQRQLHLRSDDN